MPSGLIMDYAGSSAPTGWLLCDGTSYSTTTYSTLFTAIAYTWGGSGGSFNVPDLRNKMTIGAGASYSLGTSGGSATTTIATANLPAHNHAINDTGHTHTVGITDPGHGHTVGISDPGHTHGGPGGNNYMVRNTSGAFFTGTTTANMSQASTTASATTGVSSTGATSSTTGITASGNSNTTGITTQNTGSGTAITTISPYAAVNKIIKT